MYLPHDVLWEFANESTNAHSVTVGIVDFVPFFN
jgi:hypothetical protein